MAVVLLLSFAVARESRSEFRSPEQLASGQTFGLGHDVAVDQFGFLRSAFVRDGALVLVTRTPDGDVIEEIDRGGSDPSLASFSLGIAVAYVWHGEDGRYEVRIRFQNGGTLRAPQTIATSTRPLLRPSVRFGRGGQAIVVWEERRDGAPHVWLYRPSYGALDIGAGTDPRVEVDRSGRIHVFLRRGANPYRATDAGATAPGEIGRPERLWDDLGIQGLWSSATVDGWKRFLLFTSDGDLWLAGDETGAFERKRIVEGAVSAPNLRVTSTGLLVITYVKDGDIWYILGNGETLAPPERYLASEADESFPRIEADAFENLYLLYVSDRTLWLATNSSAPRASFELDPPRGEAPLSVSFTDQSFGAVTSWQWDFGDGTTSSRQHPEHVYEDTGEYTVTLTVSSPSGRSPLTHSETVLVIEPGHQFWIGRTRAFPGQAKLHVPVLATTRQSLQGFQIAATFDATRLRVESVDFVASNIGTLQPELHLFTLSNDVDEPYVTAGVLLDVDPPFDRRVIPPGESLRLANIVVDVLSGARSGEVAAIELQHGVGRPPIDNVFVTGAMSLVPVLGEAGGVFVDTVTFPPPRFFRRGDIDRSGNVTISDAIQLLGYLFLGDAAPSCADAGDTTDDGKIDISDPLYVLNFLFRGGSYLPAPFPDAGLDPTPDALPDCRF